MEKCAPAHQKTKKKKKCVVLVLLPTNYITVLEPTNRPNHTFLCQEILIMSIRRIHAGVAATPLWPPLLLLRLPLSALLE